MFTNFRYVTTFIAPEIAFCMGYLIAQEFHERTINQLFTYSIGRLPFLFAKYAVMVLMVVVTILLELGGTVAAGLLTDHAPLTSQMVWHYTQAFGWLTLMSFAFLPFAATLAMIWKSYLPNALVGLLTLVFGIIVANSDYALYFPWSTPITLLDGWMKKGSFAASGLDVTLGFVTLAVTFLLPFVFNLYYFKKMDVDNA